MTADRWTEKAKDLCFGPTPPDWPLDEHEKNELGAVAAALREAWNDGLDKALEIVIRDDGRLQHSGRHPRPEGDRAMTDPSGCNRPGCNRPGCNRPGCSHESCPHGRKLGEPECGVPCESCGHPCKAHAWDDPQDCHECEFAEPVGPCALGRKP